MATRRKRKGSAIRPGAVARDYFSRLIPMVDIINELIERTLVARLEALANEQRQLLGLDSPVDDVARIAEDLKSEFATLFPQSQMAGIAQVSGEEGNNVNRTQVEAQLKSLGLDVFADSPRLGETMNVWNRVNVKLIGSIPATAFNKAEDIVMRGLTTGARPEVIQKEVEEQFNVTKNRAKLIARDQIGKLNAQLTRQRHLSNGIQKSIWRTLQDERVREDHEALEGRTFDNNKGVEGLFPGEPINCRCFAEPIIVIGTGKDREILGAMRRSVAA